jgi:PBP1b-binding outer membrane lipoprotein LpoB
MKIRHSLALVLATTLMLAGCSQQGAQSAPPSAPSPQQNAPAPAAQSSSTLHHDGCTIEMVKVCQAAIDQQQFVIEGVQMDARRLEQSSTSHV